MARRGRASPQGSGRACCADIAGRLGMQHRACCQGAIAHRPWCRRTRRTAASHLLAGSCAHAAWNQLPVRPVRVQLGAVRSCPSCQVAQGAVRLIYPLALQHVRRFNRRASASRFSDGASSTSAKRWKPVASSAKRVRSSNTRCASRTHASSMNVRRLFARQMGAWPIRRTLGARARG